jgi:lysophospholipase L1-like esterase
MRHTKILLAAALLCLPAAAPKSTSGNWTADWTEALSANNPGAPIFNNTTFREVAHLSAGGIGLRVRLSNEFGAGTLSFGAVHIAHSLGTGQIDPATDVALTFGGAQNVDIPSGASAVSDPVPMTVPPQYDLAISLYITAMDVISQHTYSMSTTYDAPGNQAAAATMANQVSGTGGVYVEGVDVEQAKPTKTVVALGDSTTDGVGGYVDANDRWPDFLAAMLTGAGQDRVSVANEGLGSNTLITPGGVGPTAVARFDHDVLALPGRKWVTVLEGINDIGVYSWNPQGAATVAQLIAAYQHLVARAHDAGLLVYGMTVLPFGGSDIFSAQGEQVRQAFNAYIRTAGTTDALADTDAALRDPNNPQNLLAAYDSGDHLHPSPAGYQAMANSFVLKNFQK